MEVPVTGKGMLSYSRGPLKPDLLPLCIGQMLDRNAAEFPDVPALIVCHSHDRFTWSELHREVERVGRALMALGVAKGDRVGMWATNYTEWVLVQFATAAVGAILVTLNPLYREHELEYALKQSECQSIIMIRGFRDCDYVETVFNLVPELKAGRSGHFHSARLPFLKHAVFIGDDCPAQMLPWRELCAMADSVSEPQLRERQRTLCPDDAINIQYTSGTTGYPKGATLTHYNVLNNGLFIGDGMKLTERDRVCIPVPFYHCFGMVLGNMACITHASAMVIPAAYFDPHLTLQAVADERATALYGVPTMFIAEFALPDFKRFDLSSLRTGIMAGSTCPIELMKRVVDEMHCTELTICYGLTEASPVITQTTTDDPLELRVATVGRVQPHTECKIIDPGNGALVPRNTVGELCARGYLIMKGYYNDSASTAEAIEADGWLHTGDLATMDDEGYVRITGRIKDLIIRGGENIYPREIEEYLHTCPSIADVQVIGVPDPKYGEAVMAWIKLKAGATLTAEDVVQFCKGQIANFKIPRHIRFVDSFPMTVSGKVQKFKMREVSIADVGSTHTVHVTVGASSSHD